MKCYNCGNFGHSAKNCPSGVMCHKCKQKGHISKNCPLSQNNNNNINNNVNNEKGEMKCYNCGKVGHKMSECPNKQGKYCYLCGKSGHIQAHCPNKNKNNKKEEKKGDDDMINVEDNNVINCPICFSNSSSGKKFKVGNCGHIICKECCDSLFKSSNSTHCPICKKPLNKNNFMDIFV